MSQSQESILKAVWFGRQAVIDGFLAPEDFASHLFRFVEEENEESFPALLQSAHLLSPFQSSNLLTRLEKLPAYRQSLAPQSSKQPSAPSGRHPFNERHSSADVSVVQPGQSDDASDEEGGRLSISERYELLELIQQGGVGRIFHAFDHVVGREVAIKCLQHPNRKELRELFENEYRITGRLEHPNIISIHDADYMEEIGPFYVMRLLGGQTLGEVLRKSEEHEIHGRAAYLRIFLEICAAISYAHTKGILHRDLKPSNIMVGDLGEVQVVDWGIALDLTSLPTHPQLKNTTTPVRTHKIDSRPPTPDVIVGTPGYMSPEQAKGESVDQRTDIFSLGVILYEILTGQLPFQGTQPEDYLESLMKAPLSPGQLLHGIDKDLEEITMTCLALEPSARFASVRELSLELIHYMEGNKSRKIRRQRAAAKIAEGLQARRQMESNESQAQQILRHVRKSQALLKPYESIENKRPVWEKEKQIQQLEREAILWLGEAVSSFNQALALDPESPEARKHLADLYFERSQVAAQKRDSVQAAYFESMLKRYNEGRYDGALKHEGSVCILSDPPDAEITLHPLREVDRRLLPQEGQALGQTPLAPCIVPAGSYLAILTKEGFAPTTVPILIQKEKKLTFRARLYKPEDIPPAFRYMPQGKFLMGGDPMTASTGRIQTPFVDDLFVSCFPVTMGEYLDFLNHFPLNSVAQLHSPRRSPDGGYYLEQDAQGRWKLPEIDEEGDTWKSDWPVFSISYFDAQAYADWMAHKTKLPIRLPFSTELEKAARGVDGRYHPWGDLFDPTFCKMGKSQRGAPKPESIGLYDKDCSVYGIRDLAGTIREWCGDDVEDPDGAVAFGSSWSGSELACRAAHRWQLQRSQIAPGIGFRLAMDAPQCHYHAGFGEIPTWSQAVHIKPVSAATHPALPPSLFSDKISSPIIWEALIDGDEDLAFAHLAFAAISNGSPWAAIISKTEEMPLATAGSIPDPFPLPLSNFFAKQPTHTEGPLAPDPSLLAYPFSSDPPAYLLLPTKYPLSELARKTLCAALQYILQRKHDAIRSRQLEQQTRHEVKHAQKQLTIVREALANIAPETYLNERYPLLDGRSAPMQKLFRLLDRIVESDVNVLIFGESGVGKERVARTIHQNSHRSDGPFVALNCGAIPENLVENELFGHAKGAFTGAEKEHIGLFREADQGLLFLDEVGELSLDSQVKLLRVLQNRSVRPIGGTVEYSFDTRIISATHKNLWELVEKGLFREDLYYRLIVIEAEIPPLRKRPEDIPILISKFFSDWGVHREISEEAMELLQSFTWPGNIRELENELRRLLVIGEKELISTQSLSKKLRLHEHKMPSLKTSGTLKELVLQVERQAIELALQQADGNKSKAAKRLGLSRRGLQLKIDRFLL